MYITSPDPLKRTIEEYDFSFTNRDLPTIFIDRTAGDTVDLDTYPHAILISLVERPTLDPKKPFPAEQITIFTANLISIHKRTKEVDEPTQEQKDLFRLTVQELSKTIQ